MVLMDLIPTDQFMLWAAERHIGPDEQYNPPRCLVYRPYRDVGRFWVRPRSTDGVRHFVGHLLDGLEPWDECRVWRRGGWWVGRPYPRSRLDEVRHAVFYGPDVPDGLRGALGYSRTRRAHLVERLVDGIAVAWSSNDDLFVIPHHGRMLLYVDHHDVVHVEFSEERYVDDFIEHMAQDGYRLPTELPDQTFRHPSWMK
jgi:hypothetical protein